MQTQIERARRTDPVTSHMAAKKAERFAGSHKGRILSALDFLRPDPANVDLIAYLTGLTVVQVDRRLCELQRDGLIEPTGEVEDGYRVWRLL